ncbi:hypothetical protein GCM10023085_36670 [Actinomadura viridis]|uniref:Coiled-coil protein SlyX n=1 Tax=Actinomadura viridis TaxID=58110 RepID=A0A931GHU1_9ACTN|nr:hypothetical protein [Actinomadura viridis]MBG6087798.1 putative coiled-coil protein SlyX [Actinomadura viridis]
MTTVILVVMCLVVGALELYAGKQSKDQARAFVRRIDELNDQVTKQNNVLVTVGEQLTAELARVKRDTLPALDSRLRSHAEQVEELATLVHRADDYLRTQAGRLHDLEQQRITLAALRRKLAEVETSVRSFTRAGAAAVESKVDTALDRLVDLERNGDEILELQRTLTRTLEEVEDVVAELLRFTEGELDGAVSAALTGRPRPAADDAAAVRATGRLWTRDGPLEDILTEMYERCVRAARLDIRFRASEGSGEAVPGTAERRRYFLAGQHVEDLIGAFTALLISTGADLPRNGTDRPHPRALARVEPGRSLPPGVEPARPPEDEAALKSLLRTLYESNGAVAQIGPLMAVRTRDELLCAVLTPPQSLELESDEVFWDPAAAGLRLRRLPSHQLWDLTAWAAVP